MTDARIAKLPKWAREEIEYLEAQIVDLREKLADGPADSDTFVHEYGPRGENAGPPLGKGARIRFELGDERFVYAHIERGHVSIQGVSRRMTSDLLIRSRSSNFISVEVE